ncbi:MAG: ADP-ribosylglycohydrolase family protein [Spirochaetaceae bacterium]
MTPRSLPVYGAIAGDIVGSRFEGHPTKSREFDLDHDRCRYTDDTVLTVATAKAILDAATEATEPEYAAAYKTFGRRDPHRGYGGSFRNWLASDSLKPYGSFGNGSAMRVSPIGCAFDSQKAVLEQAKLSAAATHDHPEGIKGAQAVAYTIWRCRTDPSVQPGDLEYEITALFGYALDMSLDAIRPSYRFDVTCQGSVPQAIIAFLEARSTEDAIRNAVSLGGDSDTQACMAGAMAAARFGTVSEELTALVRRRLPEEYLRLIDALDEL